MVLLHARQVTSFNSLLLLPPLLNAQNFEVGVLQKKTQCCLIPWLILGRERRVFELPGRELAEGVGCRFPAALD